MKQSLVTVVVLLFVSNIIFSQSIDKNHIVVIVPKVETTFQNLSTEISGVKQNSETLIKDQTIQDRLVQATTSIKVSSQSLLKSGTTLKISSQSEFNSKFAQEVTYFDGFGKPIQEITVGSNTDGNDIVKHFETDEFGREVKSYLPVTVNQNNGNFVNNIVSQIGTYYQTKFNDFTPFIQKRFDNTPLNRLEEASSHGDDWKILPDNAGHTTKFEYGFNTFQDKIRKYSIDENSQISYSLYDEKLLQKQIIKNENWKVTDNNLNTKEIYTDQFGKIVSEISYVQNNGQVQKLISGYVYDDFGRLLNIISPLASEKTAPISDRNLNLNDFVPNGVQGGGSGSIEQTVDRININYNASFSSTYLKTGQLFYIHNQISDRDLGSVLPIQGSQNSGLPAPPLANNYIAYIKDGYFCLKSIDPFDPSPYVSSIDFAFEIPFTKVVLNSEEILNELTTQYKYDEFTRKVAQKMPGKGWEYIVYDKLDRPIMVQDASLKKNNFWIFTRYDNFGREVYKGKCIDARTRDQIQSEIKDYWPAYRISEKRISTPITISGTQINYTNDAFPRNFIQEILSVNYYDNYDNTDSDRPLTPTLIENQQVTNKLKGLITSTWVKTLGANTWTKKYLYYDVKGRLIRVFEKNINGGYTQTDSRLDFAGAVQNTITKHKRISSSIEVVIRDNFKYDNSKRLISHSQIINNQTEERLYKNIYSDFGQLKQKEIGGNLAKSPLQLISYKNNIRGWLTDINDVNNIGNSLFAFKINYHKNFEGFYNSPEEKYDGSIGQVIWKNKYNNEKKSYTYNYDQLNRLKGAEYAYGETLSEFSASSYSEYINNYDANGNIQNLTRNGVNPYNGYTTQVDGLNYRYNQGNKLLEVFDSGLKEKGFVDNYTIGTNDYEYNENGNLIKDTNKNITSIIYNHLDLVQQVTFNDGKTIAFVYDASGKKLSKTFTNAGVTTTTEYLGAFQYQQQQLQFFATTEGYAYFNPTQNNFKYAYHYSDHLGNIRLSYSDADGNGAVTTAEILSATDYYPMGMIIYDYNSSVASNYNYKLQGKEYQQEGNIDLYDFGSRMYDPAVGRWFCPDPQNQYYSPYLAMGNNYANAVDPDGEWVQIVVGAVIGAVSTVIANPDAGFEDILIGAVMGAASGTLAYGVGSAVTQLGVTGVTKALVSAGLHAITRGMTTHMLGSGNFGRDALVGGVSSLGASATQSTGAAGQIALGAFSGGVTSHMAGGSFEKGFWDGLVISALNHTFHEAMTSLDNYIQDSKNKFYKSESEAYEEAYKQSHNENGEFIREVSGYKVNGGYIVLDPSGNLKTKTYNNQLTVKKINGVLKIEYNGKWYEIKSHFHTHPVAMAGGGVGGDSIGISFSDLKFYSDNRLNNSHILYGKGIYEVNINQQGRYEAYDNTIDRNYRYDVNYKGKW